MEIVGPRPERTSRLKSIMGSRTELITVEQSLPMERLDTFLRSQFPAVSRGTIQRLIDQGHIRVNGRVVKPTHHPRAGDQVEVHWPEAKSAEARPENIPLEILFEDQNLLVINKPPGMVVHPGAGHDQHTVVNAVLFHCQGQLSGIGGVARPGIVHRLDKDTSGCLVIAKNDPTHLGLADQFATRGVTKIYQALVCGRMSQASGQIRAAIARHSTHRKRMAVTTGEGREALTSFSVVEQFEHATWIEVRLHTGRTHQIRVHFQHVGHPLVGDHVYGMRTNIRLTELTGYTAPRQMLHAWRLSFTDPIAGNRLKLEAPLPSDFQEAVRLFRGGGVAKNVSV